METNSNDAITLVGIKSENPEITGSETLDFSFEIPMGSTAGKVVLKATSTVASSIVAQERLNAMARENINFLGSKIAEGIRYIMDNCSVWATKIHELNMLHQQWRQQEETKSMAD